MKALLRAAVILAGLVLIWQATVSLTGLPPFLLPPPMMVAERAVKLWPVLLENAGTTLIEILAGLFLGTLFGLASAVTLSAFRPVRQWLMPVIVTSQAVPVFALAPLLTLWFGYGLASKVAMATLIIYFPVTTTLYDGLRSTNAGWLDLARTMGARPSAILLHIRLPAALPAFASGLRMAAAIAPIGAVVGEWVGSSAGLGFLMLHANGRMQIDLMFAALFVLAIMSVGFYYAVDYTMCRLIRWQPETPHPGTG